MSAHPARVKAAAVAAAKLSAKRRMAKVEENVLVIKGRSRKSNIKPSSPRPTQTSVGRFH